MEYSDVWYQNRTQTDGVSENRLICQSWLFTISYLASFSPCENKETSRKALQCFTEMSAFDYEIGLLNLG